MTTHPRDELAAKAHTHLDGGGMDCGSGLLLLLTRRMRDLGPGQGLLVRTEDASVPSDLLDWSRLAGHEFAGQTEQGDDGAWHVLVRRGDDGTTLAAGVDSAGPDAVPRENPGPGQGRPGSGQTDTTFTSGSATPVGERLWIYTNFHCNLACGYCCARSSPAADPRLMPLSLTEAVAAEFAALGGRELFVTGGEPFLHPQIAETVAACSSRLPTTILTNAMVIQRGARRRALESLDRDRVTLQISLDSADSDLHDRQRGDGSHARALEGIQTVLGLGFPVRIAATWFDDEPAAGAAWTALLDRWQIPEPDRLVRPVARQGFAEEAGGGEQVTVDSLAPEPTVTADGIWWHPVAVTDPVMQVADAPLPLAAALDTIRDTVAVQDAARREGRRHVFRCA